MRRPQQRLEPIPLEEWLKLPRRKRMIRNDGLLYDSEKTPDTSGQPIAGLKGPSFSPRDKRLLTHMRAEINYLERKLKELLSYKRKREGYY